MTSAAQHRFKDENLVLFISLAMNLEFLTFLVLLASYCSYVAFKTLETEWEKGLKKKKNFILDTQVLDLLKLFFSNTEHKIGKHMIICSR